MKATIIYSTLDPAGCNAAKHLIKERGFKESEETKAGGMQHRCWTRGNVTLIELKTSLLEANYADEFRAELIVFASKHASESGLPCLTTHSTGNWGTTGMGGSERELGLTSAKAKKTAFGFLREHELKEFKTTMEATHHGPTCLQTPSIFVEVGSTEKEWKNEEATKLLAETVLHACENFEHAKGKTALGFGGNHYCAKFNELSDYAFSHVAAKHSLDFVDSKMVKHAIEKTLEKVEGAVIDWKGCGSEQRKKLIKAIEENGLNYEKV